MENTIVCKPPRKSPPKGTRKANSGSFVKNDPRFAPRRAIDPETGKPIAISELARRDTHLALAVIREVLSDNKQRIEMRLSAAKTLVSLGWAAAPRTIVSSVTHHAGNLPSVNQLVEALHSGQPIHLPELPTANEAVVIDMEAPNSIEKGASDPVTNGVYRDPE